MLPILQNIAPQKALNVIAHTLANCKVSWIKNQLIRYFVNKYPVRLEEAVEENPYLYTDFNHFFTRALKPHLRPLTPGQRDIASPVDGCISQWGQIENGTLVQAKGFLYNVCDLLGGDAEAAAPFLNGHFLTAYLAPKDYHRVHMPTDGTLAQMTYIPGQLFSVNHRTAEHISGLFARNERVVTVFNTNYGRMAVILVGAMIVGSIETVWAGTITPPRNSHKGIKTWDYETSESNTGPISLDKGQEMGRFKLGSTVILLFEKNRANWNPALQAKQDILMGECLGTFSDTL